jgi:hypothetical protein
MTATLPLQRLTVLSALCLTSLLAACGPLGFGTGDAPVVAMAPVLPEPPGPSVESAEARLNYAKIQANLLSQGLMRRDAAPADAPFTAADLAEDFINIALYDEYVDAGGTLVARKTESRLRRWDRPVRIGVEFGAGIPPDQQARDRTDIAAYAARLARVTGHPIRLDDAAPNFRVLILNEDERQAIGPRLNEIVPNIDPAAVTATVAMPKSSYCVVFAFSKGTASAYSQAVAVIRGEHPDLLRLLCIHEEIAQGLGLANDSPGARPSIFNDDEEFALLTRHDELLLRMLYDPRMRSGMTIGQARPLAEAIARDLMAGES